MSDIIQNISISVVREFLKRKGLSVTYQALETESPRTESSITNRTELARLLKIERLLKKNKEQRDPLKTILEVITQCFLQKGDPTDHGSLNLTNKHSRVGIRAGSEGVTLLEEDDLETELLVGRGMEHVMQQPLEVVPPLQPKPPNKRRHRRNLLQATQGQGADQPKLQSQTSMDFHEEINGANSMTSHEEITGGKKEYSRCYSSDERIGADRAESETSGETSTDSPSLTDPVQTSSESVSQEPPDAEKPLSASPALQDLTTSSMTVTDEVGKDVEERKPETGTEPSTPRPPLKVPDYVSSSIKSTDLEKSMERLRERRIAHLANTQVQEENNLGVEGTAEADDKNESVGGEEESYSPRIIYNDPEPLADSLLEKDEADTKGPVMNGAPVQSEESISRPATQSEETANQQKVEYMTVKEVISSAKAIDIHTASELKRLVLGSASQSFPDNWLGQGLGFCDMPAVLFGMVQHQPGTSGLMTVVQGYFLLELLYLYSLTRDLPMKRKLSPPSHVRSELLAHAISKLLWKCGEEKKAVFALPGESTIFSGGGRFRPDGITENLVLNTVTTYDDAVTFALQFISYFENDDSNGTILLLYSAVLSRGIELVVDDMDSSDTPLITEQGSCSPELVHLLLCGKAASNVFNDSLEFTQGLGKTVVLKGIPTRSDMGLLSLLEHLDRGRRNSRKQVGTFLKTPKFPIWLCHIEEHYSLVFCLNKELVSDWKAERRFDLLYYDPLSCMEEPIRLTMDTTSRFFEPPEDDDGVPPLELCLRTKWRDAQIDWNGAEPIAAKSATDPFEDIL